MADDAKIQLGDPLIAHVDSSNEYRELLRKPRNELTYGPYSLASSSTLATNLLTQRIRDRVGWRVRISRRSPFTPPSRCPQPHSDLNPYSQQSQAPRPRQSFRSPHEHGPRECQGDVDRDSS